MNRTPALPWLEPGDPFPDTSQAWGPESPAPGLLAAGGALDVETLRRAYGAGIFPWFSAGQPRLWWSPEPRMVLDTGAFRLHRSLRKHLTRGLASGRLVVHMDTAFGEVIRACANSRRNGQRGTWIVPEMVEAYERMHAAGLAHSVETWVDGQLAGGLYLVAVGRAVFGESMFTRQSDASKTALAALVAFCRVHRVTHIDCQQNTPHLASLGAADMPRQAFVQVLERARERPGLKWQFQPVYWNEVLP